MAPHVDDENRKEVQSYLDENASDGKNDFRVDQMAELGEVGDLYIFYKQLSSDAAHPNIEALERYYDEALTNGVRRLKWGPSIAAEQMNSTVLHACCFLLVACGAANEMFGSAELTSRLESKSTDYKALMERYGDMAL